MSDADLLEAFEEGKRDVVTEGISAKPTDRDYLLAGLRAVYESSKDAGKTK